MEKLHAKNIDKVMIEIIQNGHSVFGWKSLNGVIEKCEFKAKAIRNEFNEIELEVAPKETKNISVVLSGDREINFYVPESSVSFTAKLKNTVDEKKLKINIPTEYSFYERRRHERVQVPKSFFSFEYNKAMIKKGMFDISLGGFSFVLSKNEKIIMRKGTILKDCIVELNARKMKMTLECVSSQTIDRYKLDSLPYGGHKISFRFISMTKEDREYLTNLVTIHVLQGKKLKGA